MNALVGGRGDEGKRAKACLIIALCCHSACRQGRPLLYLLRLTDQDGQKSYAMTETKWCSSRMGHAHRERLCAVCCACYDRRTWSKMETHLSSALLCFDETRMDKQSKRVEVDQPFG
eukprot:m.33497 g.33497  ORF g.33497 m.33497 type:complete len:117 (+) comp10891_c0_seq2:111-461(+)